MPDRSPERRFWSRPGKNDVAAGAVFAAVVIFSGLFESAPAPFRWIYLFIAALLGFVGHLTTLIELLSAAIGRALSKLKVRFARRTVARILVWTMVIGIGIVFGRVLVPLAAAATQWAAVRAFGCPNATELRMVSTTEDLATVQQFAEVYTRGTASTNQGCPTVHFHVYAMPPELARDELRGGWSGNQLAEWGPRPDLWLPGSVRYTITDAAQASNGLLIDVDPAVVASTPLVLAVPASASAATSTWPPRLDWAEGLAAASQAGMDVIRPDVTRSVPAEMATVAMYASGGGELTRLANPPAADLKLIDPARARALERALAQAADTHRYSMGDSADLLCQHRSQERPAAAFAVTEHQMVRFNRGLALDGGVCAVDTFPVQVNGGLLAIYPTDTLNIDYPVMRVTWHNTSPAQRAHAKGFVEWLSTAAGKNALNGAGLRPPGWPVGEPIGTRYGARPGVPYPHIAVAGEVLNEVGRRHRVAVQPGRFLIALDASGSMKALVGGGPRNRFAVALDAVAKVADKAGRDEDQFGLWVFQGSGSKPRELLPIGHHPQNAASAALQGVAPDGDTPLYRAIKDGVTALATTETDTTKSLIVLTDGDDHGSGISPRQMIDAVIGKNVKVFVLAIGEARCATAALHEVTTATLGKCSDVPTSGVETALTDLFTPPGGES